VTLGGKSPEPVSFDTETTLDMIIVPTTGVFLVKVFSTKCTEEEFVPSVISSGSRQVGILGGKN
jgi:hypothetical protein